VHNNSLSTAATVSLADVVLFAERERRRKLCAVRSSVWFVNRRERLRSLSDYLPQEISTLMQVRNLQYSDAVCM